MTHFLSYQIQSVYQVLGKDLHGGCTGFHKMNETELMWITQHISNLTHVFTKQGIYFCLTVVSDGTAGFQKCLR